MVMVLGNFLQNSEGTRTRRWRTLFISRQHIIGKCKHVRFCANVQMLIIIIGLLFNNVHVVMAYMINENMLFK